MAQWCDLAEYDMKMEAWQDAKGNWYGVVIGDVEENATRLNRLGGRRINLFSSNDLPAFIFSLPWKEPNQVVRARWKRQFPKARIEDMDPGSYVRMPSDQEPAKIREEVGRLLDQAATKKEELADIQAEKTGWVFISNVQDGRVLEEERGSRRRAVVDEEGRVIREEAPYPDHHRVDVLYARVGPLESIDLSAIQELFLYELKRLPEHTWSLDEIRNWLSRITGESVSRIREMNLPDRHMQDAMEGSVMMRASEIASEFRGESDSRRILSALRALYDHQPLMSMRTTQSINLGQYSTPAPMGWLLQYAVDLTRDDQVLEPTFGTGSLVTAADPDNVVGWELDRSRQRIIQRRYRRVVAGDFLQGEPVQNVDVVMANPPFNYPGTINEMFHGEIRIQRIDRLMALKALDYMRDDGRAALILAPDRSQDGGIPKSAKRFYNYLYDHYDVVDHFNVDGGMYARQGTRYGVQVIIIAGRRPEPIEAETPDELPLITTYDQLYERASDARRIVHERKIESGSAAEAIPGAAAVPGALDDRDLGATVAGAAGGALRGESVPGELDGDGAARDRGAAERGTDEPGDRLGGHREDGGGLSSAGGGEAGQLGGGSGGPGGERGDGDQPEFAVSQDTGISGAGAGVRPDDGREEAGGAGRGDGADAKGSPAMGEGAGQEGRPEGGSAPAKRHGASGTGGSNARKHVRVEQVNRLQARYNPKAAAPALNTTVPANLELPTRQALERVEAEHGDLVRYVSQNMRLSEEQVKETLYAEQIDALALAFDQYEKGRGFVIGDMTGVGKTRVIIGLMVRSLIDGKYPILMTPKANLFKDLVLEAENMGVGFLFNPAVINRISAIRNEANEILVAPVETPTLERMYENKTLMDYNAVFLTYSQINRQDSPRQEWLESVVGDNVLILDESHRAGGYSNTGENVLKLSEKASFVFYSSATYAKRPDNYRIYHRVIGKLVLSKSFRESMFRGGEPLQEVLSSMMAEDGSYIRREHDYSHAIFNTYVDHANSDEHRETSDLLSNVLHAMAMISGEISGSTKPVNEELRKELKKLKEQMGDRNYLMAKRMGISCNNFASRMANISRQFMLCMKTESVSTLAIQAIRSGKAPVIFVDGTMETFLQESLASVMEDTPEDLFGENELPPANLSFGDVLKRTVRRLMEVVVTDRYGEQERIDLLNENWQDHPILGRMDSDDVKERLQRLLELADREIEKLPDIPLSPIDAIKATLEREGFSMGEISGRSLGIDYNAPGGPRFFKRSKEDKDRNLTIERFNNGIIGPGGEREFSDAILVTAAGAEGISLNASNAFRNRKQREMILPQAPLDINNYIQLLGRIFRANMDLKKVPPIYTTVIMDIPAERRPAALLLKKQASLSANTTSNSESFSNLDAEDMMNWLGDEVALTYLLNNGEVLARTQIDLDEELKKAKKDKNTGLMSRLTARGLLLSSDEFEEMYSDLEEAYRDRLETITAHTGNPFRTKEYELNAREVNRYLFEGSEEYETAFDAPIYLSVIEYEVDRKPITHEEAMKVCQSTSTALGSSPLWAFRDQFEQEMARRIRSVYEHYDIYSDEELRKQYPKQMAKIDQMAEERKMFEQFCETGVLKLGNGLAFKSEDEEEDRVFWFVRVFEKDPKRMGYLGNYSLRFIEAGADEFKTISLSKFAKMFAEGRIRVLSNFPLESGRVKEAFDEAPRGKEMVNRCVLTGNMMKASEWSAQNSKGVSSVIIMENGERLRGIVLPETVQADMFLSRPMRLNKFEEIKQYFELRRNQRNPRVEHYVDKSSYLVLLPKDENTYSLRVYGRQDYLKNVVRDEKLVELSGDEGFSGRSVMVLDIYGDSRAKEVLDHLYREYGVIFSTPAKDPDARKDILDARNNSEETVEMQDENTLEVV